MLGNSWVAAQLAASQEGLSSMELVNYMYLMMVEIGRNMTYWQRKQVNLM
jgi:hypothetical protein